LGDRQSSHPVKTLLQHYGKSLEALPGVAYPGFINTVPKLDFKKNGHELAELKQQKSKRLILLRSTLTLWQCAAEVTSAFPINSIYNHMEISQLH